MVEMFDYERLLPPALNGSSIQTQKDGMNILNVISRVDFFEFRGKMCRLLFRIKLVAFSFHFAGFYSPHRNDVTGNCLECTCLFHGVANVRDCFVLLYFVLVSFSFLFNNLYEIILHGSFRRRGSGVQGYL